MICILSKRYPLFAAKSKERDPPGKILFRLILLLPPHRIRGIMDEKSEGKDGTKMSVTDKREEISQGIRKMQSEQEETKKEIQKELLAGASDSSDSTKGKHKLQEEWKSITRAMFSITEDTASHEEIRDRLYSGGKISGTNMCVMVCAIFIASIGLNTNSTAVIIGAMLISPLMGTILATAYGTVSGDYVAVRKYLTGFVFQILYSLGTSTVYFLLSPLKETTSELLARTNPSVYDIMIATAGGIAGIIGQTRKDKANNIIPGVAIATALMPPLCTCGYSIANGKLQMFLGAAYLFLVNSYFIYMSACLVLALLRIPQMENVTPEQWTKKKNRMIRNAIIVALPAILIGFLVHQTQ